MAITKFYKIIQPKSANVDMADSHDVGGNRGLYGNYTWYSRLVQGSANRITRYREYDVMDSDIDIARALDIIAEEMAGNNPKTQLPLQIEITAGNEQKVKSSTVVTLNAALKTWCAVQSWQTRLFNLIRTLIKYGDIFFFKTKKKNKKWIYINPKNVVGAVVTQEDITDVKAWHIKTDTKKAQGNLGTNLYYNLNGSMYDQNVDVFNTDEIVRYTMHDDMSDEAPFGESILRTVFRVFKQKELLEDSILIYRISRAPERRVFKIEMGKMPPQKAAAHLEQIKNEIKQRKIPTMQGGQNKIESIYNPISQSEDYFFQQRDGNGSTVEVLPGGQNLGELSDLNYFYQKLWRGLRIPGSYMNNTNDDAQQFNDGAVGLAYQQEIKFSQYVERLQTHVEIPMDREFKNFLHDMSINIDPTIFQLRLPVPTNWAKSRQQKIDNDLVAVYNNIKDDPSTSKRFAKTKYLQWTKEELLTNERMLREEKGLDPEGGINDLPQLYAPEEAEAGGFEGGLGSVGGDGGNFENGEDLGEGEEGEQGEGENNENGSTENGNTAEETPNNTTTK